MSKKKWWIVGAVVTIAILIAAVVKSRVADKGFGVEVAEASKQDIIETVSANGKIEPEVEVSISPEVSGEIVKVTIEEGDYVEKGALLIEINPELLQASTDRAEASVNNALANLENTKARKIQSEARLKQVELSFKRTKALYKEGAVSTAELETAEAEYAVAKAEVLALEKSEKAAQYTVQSARAGLKEAKEALRRTQIYAPMSGTVSKLLVEVGERVVGTAQMTGTEMIRIADMRNMEVNVEVNESDIIRVKVGDTALVEVDAYLDRKFKALVSQVANSANSSALSSADQVTTFEVKMLLLPISYNDLLKGKSEHSSPFRPGMSAAVEIQTQRKQDVLSVPIQSVTVREDSTMQSQECVFIYNGTRVEQREVETGIQDGKYIEITAGLNEGDKVVSGPYAVLSKSLMDGSLAFSTSDEEPTKKD